MQGCSKGSSGERIGMERIAWLNLIAGFRQMKEVDFMRN